MELLIRRQWPNSIATIGALWVDDGIECFTLEDPVREVPGIPVEQWKIAGNTAIPAGAYKVVFDHSVRFGCVMPHILDVPGFQGIRIHPGNTSADTEGCILLGVIRSSATRISNSRLAFDALTKKMLAAIKRGEGITLTIKNQEEPPTDAWPNG